MGGFSEKHLNNVLHDGLGMDGNTNGLLESAFENCGISHHKIIPVGTLQFVSTIKGTTNPLQTLVQPFSGECRCVLILFVQYGHPNNISSTFLKSSFNAFSTFSTFPAI